MIIDARDPGVPERMEADIAIVGAGAAGIVLALVLAATGRKVVLIEAGGEKFSKASQEFYRAQQVEPVSHGPVDMFRRRVLGGSTSVWGGRCIPFDPIDFEDRDWIAHGRWPIRYEDVARHYPAALQWLDAGPAQFDAGAALPGEPADMVPAPPSDDVVLNRIERFSHPLHLGSWYRERLEESANLTVLIEAPVRRILSRDEGRKIAGVQIARQGRTGTASDITIGADRVIVCAGGLETVRLLLSSDQDKACGLGNEKGLVGRFYQCHLEGEIGQIQFTAPARQIRQDYEVAPNGTYCRRYIWLSPEAQRRKRLAGLVLRPSHPNIVDPAHENPVLSAMYLAKNWIVPEYARKLTSLEDCKRLELSRNPLIFWGAHVRNMALGAPRLAAFTAHFVRHRTLAQRKLPSVVLRDPREIYPLDINAEQEPNRDSRVFLGDQCDAFGMRRLVVDWRTTSADHQRLVEGLKTLAAAFAQSDAARLHFEEDDFALARESRIPVGGHHIGTARMASNPAEGVCDANCAVFGTQGLYLAGAATFSTSGFANPTLTLVALALRLAEHLAEPV